MNIISTAFYSSKQEAEAALNSPAYDNLRDELVVQQMGVPPGKISWAIVPRQEFHDPSYFSARYTYPRRDSLKVKLQKIIQSK